MYDPFLSHNSRVSTSADFGASFGDPPAAPTPGTTYDRPLGLDPAFLARHPEWANWKPGMPIPKRAPPPPPPTPSVSPAVTAPAINGVFGVVQGAPVLTNTPSAPAANANANPVDAIAANAAAALIYAQAQVAQGMAAANIRAQQANAELARARGVVAAYAPTPTPWYMPQIPSVLSPAPGQPSLSFWEKLKHESGLGDLESLARWVRNYRMELTIVGVIAGGALLWHLAPSLLPAAKTAGKAMILA